MIEYTTKRMWMLSRPRVYDTGPGGSPSKYRPGCPQHSDTSRCSSRFRGTSTVPNISHINDGTEVNRGESVPINLRLAELNLQLSSRLSRIKVSSQRHPIFWCPQGSAHLEHCSTCQWMMVLQLKRSRKYSSHTVAWLRSIDFNNRCWSGKFPELRHMNNIT